MSSHEQAPALPVAQEPDTDVLLDAFLIERDALRGQVADLRTRLAQSEAAAAEALARAERAEMEREAALWLYQFPNSVEADASTGFYFLAGNRFRNIAGPYFLPLDAALVAIAFLTPTPRTEP